MCVSGRFPASDAYSPSMESMENISMDCMESMERKIVGNPHKINHFPPFNPAGDPFARDWRGEGYSIAKV